jgi:hypothetical protein
MRAMHNHTYFLLFLMVIFSYSPVPNVRPTMVERRSTVAGITMGLGDIVTARIAAIGKIKRFNDS